MAGEEAVGAAENTVLPISELDSQRTQKPGTLVDKEAMRKGSALQLQAFADAGLDPNRAINMPIERQFAVLSDMFVEKFGFKSVVKIEDANPKEAVDQLLVGYHNLTNLAANIGLPEKAFGLEGTLSFILAKNIGAYGVYYPGAKTIACRSAATVLRMNGFMPSITTFWISTAAANRPACLWLLRPSANTAQRLSAPTPQRLYRTAILR